MKKVIGYFLRIFSILFFVILLFQVIHAFRVEEFENKDSGYIAGYFIGVFMGLGFLGWLNYLLFRYSGKLISHQNVINEIDDIGKEEK